MTCAWSGAFLVAGAIGTVMWIFVRAVYMHLQIVWDLNPGKRFFWIAQVVGWGLPAAIFTATITVSGVSFRLGDQCHINHDNSIAVFWGPLLGLAGLAMSFQIATFAYCLKIYLLNIWSSDSTPTENSTSLPSYTTSLRTQSARAVYRRVMKVLWLQWRGMAIVCLLVIDAVAWSVVFIQLDQKQVDMLQGKSGAQTLEWVTCVMTAKGDRTKCYDLASKITVNEATVVAILILLSLSGLEICGLLYRNSILEAWKDLFNRVNPRKNHEFVSLDAITNPSATTAPDLFHKMAAYEQDNPAASLSRNNTLRIGSPHPLPAEQLRGTDFKDPYKVPSTVITSKEVLNSPPSSYASPVGSISRRDGATPEFFRNSEERSYRSPSLSFSALKAPGRLSDVRREDFDLRTPQARGGLGLHPPMEYDSDEDNRL
ncbi:MAG: hypothetical protein M1820_007281 [Bogoriella megaspora]|nr:MAG: hypothetical protein M1820_007281 [Bogoriella megaspora]